MEDPNLIATLIPTDITKQAENAFCLEHNSNRYLPPVGGIISSRESTPALSVEQEDDKAEHDKTQLDFSSTHRIQLTFSQPPLNSANGFSFGTNPRTCDVLLGYRGTVGISGLHFCITFNEDKRIILKDSSKCGTAVSYDGQVKDEVRHHFTWLLDLQKQDGSQWDIEVHVPGRDELAFKVELASHSTCEPEYDENVVNFLKNSGNALPPLNGLGIDS